MSHPSVVIAGHVCIDHNKSENATYTGWGSSVLYMAQVFTGLYGAPTTALANYGPDMVPHLPKVTLVPSTPTKDRTLVFENDSSSGKRVQHCYNTDVATPLAITQAVQEKLAAADVVVVAVLLANYGAAHIRELLAHCKPNALKVLCPQGYFRRIDKQGLVHSRPFEEAGDIVGKFDLVVFSEEDYADAFAAAQAWKQAAPNTHIVVTQSSKGASIIHADRIEAVPTTPIPPEDIVDSVGCGDTFAAALVNAYYDSHDLRAAITAAHSVAAQKLKAVYAGAATKTPASSY